MADHLVILKKIYIDAILDNKKTIESRLLKTRVAPFGKVKKNDCLYLKKSAGAVLAVANVKKVKQYENLDSEKIKLLKKQYNDKVMGADEYWQMKQNAKFAVFIWVENIKKLDTPIKIQKKDWRSWVVLTEQKNFGLLKPNQQKQQSANPYV